MQAAELEKSNQTKDKFFSIIAHDLRNPIHALVGLSELIQKDTVKDKNFKQSEIFHHLNTSVHTLQNLVEDLLSWASLQNGKMSLKPEEIDLNQLADQILKLFQENAQQKEIELSFTSSISNTFYGDRNMLNTIFRNLISNAIKFTKPGGNVSLDISQENSSHIIKVKDDGMGMDEHLVQKILHSDSIVSLNGTQDERGTGLGLPICKEMIALHDGKLEIESEVLKGSTFIVKLPFRKNNE